jgi:hypothetical protein
MCDYSLTGIDNRLAQRGEQLMVCTFSTGSKGLTSPSHLGRVILGLAAECAVCIPPGAKLRMHDAPSDVRRQHKLESQAEVKFVELDVPIYHHRDAIKFADGGWLNFQDLEDGTLFDVVSLDGAEERTPMEVREPGLFAGRSVGARD